MADIRDYTVTQEVMGTAVSTYAERAEGAGPLAYTYYVVTPAGLHDTSEGESSAAASNPYLMLDRVAGPLRRYRAGGRR